MQQSSMIGGMKNLFPLKDYLLLSQLHLQSFLIAVLTESWSQLFMNLMDGSHYIINMIF